MKKFFTNISSNLLSTILAVTVPLIAIPILTTNMGLDAYGQYIALLALSALLVTLTDFGFAMYLAKSVSETREDMESISQYVSVFLIVKTVVGLIVGGFILFLLEQNIILTSLMAMLTLINALNIFPILNGTEDYKFLAKVSIFSRGLFLMLLLVFSYQNISIEKVIFFQILSVILRNILLFYFLFYIKKIPLVKVSFVTIIDTLKGAFSFYFARLFVNIYNQSSTYFVSLLLISELVAVYSIALQLYRAGQMLIGSVSRVLFTNLVYTKDFALLKKTTFIALFMNVVFSPIVIWFGQDILSLIFDFEIKLLHMLSMALYVSLNFVIISSFWGYPALSAIGRERYAHFGIFYSSLSYYLLFFLFMFFDMLDIYGAVFCVILADFTGMVLRIYFARKFKIL